MLFAAIAMVKDGSVACIATEMDGCLTLVDTEKDAFIVNILGFLTNLINPN